MNLQIILRKLEDTGMRHWQIAKAVGSSQPTITRLINGTQTTTKFETGQAIIKFAEEKGIHLNG